MATVTQIGPRLGIAPTCAALGLPRATYYRRRRPPRAPPPRRPSPRALSAGRARRRSSPCCMSRASWIRPRRRSTPRCSTPGSTSAPSARCIASWPRTREVRERRDQLRHPVYAAPELLARRPNELWSWDITKLLGPAKWTYFYLYVMLDVFSRYVVGWMVAHRESATLAREVHRRDVRPPGHRPWAAHDPRRPRAGDDLEVRRVPARRPGRHQDPQPAARLQRQPVLGGAVQDAQVPARLPRAVRLDPGCPRPLPQSSSPGTTSNTITAVLACSPLTTCTSAWPSSAWRPGRPCSPRPMPSTRNASRAASPGRRRAPRPCGSTPRNPQRPRRLAGSRQRAVSIRGGRP